jgi:hypothetical protein
LIVRNTFLALIGGLSADVAQSQSPPLPDDFGLTIAYHLDKLSEPKLWQNCKTDETTYRILEISAGYTVAAVRVARAEDEIVFTAVSTTVPNKTTGRFGPVAEPDWTQLEDYIEAADFWNMDSDWNVWRLDGIDIYLEACKNGEYHVIKREPIELDIADLVGLFSTFPKSK